jgi:hypothetical protein
LKKIFTYVVEFRGGTYCSQVLSKNVIDSLNKWIISFESQKAEIAFLGDKTISELKVIITESENKPVELTGLKNIWYMPIYTKVGCFSINIIQTEITKASH